MFNLCFVDFVLFRSRATNSFSSLVTDDLLDEDLEPYDEEESIDEENLLREDNTTPRFDSPDPGADIVPTNSSTPFPISNDQAVEDMNSAENQHVSKDEYDNESSSVDYSDVPLGSSHDADELDEVCIISYCVSIQKILAFNFSFQGCLKNA